MSSTKSIMKSVSEIRKQGLDKFYTRPEIAEQCITRTSSLYEWDDWELVIEPSAGGGSFFNRIPVDDDKKIGIDIEPEGNTLNIIQQDFFQYTPSPEHKNILCIGNPPFGKNSSVAIQFFNHASQWCSVIAFIVPRTFRRVSVHNKLNLSFHLQHDEDIPMYPCSFEPAMSVKCCFQIWRKEEQPRQKCILSTTHSHWEFLSYTRDENNILHYPTDADFAIRAFGGRCGEIKKTGLSELKPKSWHWIRSNISLDILLSRFEKLDYSISKDTARQNSIGKGDLVSLYKTLIDAEANE